MNTRQPTVSKRHPWHVIAAFLLVVCVSPSWAELAEETPAVERKFVLPAEVEGLLSRYCYECHDSLTAKGDFKLDHLSELSLQARLDLLNKALEQAYNGEMPPKKADQPKVGERERLVEWISGELKAYNASKLEDKLRHYKYANYLDHEKLFSGEIETEPFTRSRRWRVNELIYHERVNDVFELEGSKRRPSFYGVVKPFNLPSESGVRYYDTEIVEGGQFLTLMSNAKWIVGKQLRAALVESGEHKFSKDYLEAKAQGGRGIRSRFPDEVWNPGVTAEPFRTLILEESPGEELVRNAINHQFMVAAPPPTRGNVR